MTITFPRDLPAVRFLPGRFEPEFRQTRSTTAGGSPQASEMGPTLWAMQYTTTPLSEADAEAVRAWLLSLRGAVRKFKAWNPMRRYPVAYPNGFGGVTRQGGGAFDGTATLSAAASTLDSITVSTLPATMPIAIGDMVSIGYASGRRTLHKATEATVAVAGVATFGIEPVLFQGGPVGTAGAVTFAQPYCFAVVDPTSIDDNTGVSRTGQISFKARQVYAP